MFIYNEARRIAKELCRGSEYGIGCSHFSCKMRTGSLAGLQRVYQSGAHGAQWASPAAPLGQFLYSTYSEDDFDIIWDHYAYQNGWSWWFPRDFGKPGCAAAGARRADEAPSLHGVWGKQVGPALAQLTMPQNCLGCITSATMTGFCLGNSIPIGLDKRDNFTWVACHGFIHLRPVARPSSLPYAAQTQRSGVFVHVPHGIMGHADNCGAC